MKFLAEAIGVLVAAAALFLIGVALVGRSRP
jgi:hypothetical protein